MIKIEVNTCLMERLASDIAPQNQRSKVHAIWVLTLTDCQCSVQLYFVSQRP